jgi:hypothetical protein
MYLKSGDDMSRQICNGWAPEFERPMGKPLGPGGHAPRLFESGAEVQCQPVRLRGGGRSRGGAPVARRRIAQQQQQQQQQCRVVWPGVPPTPWPPAPAPPQPPPSRANYRGCYHDHSTATVCDLPCIPPGSSGGCSNACTEPGLKGKGCSTKMHGSKYLCPPPFTRMTLSVCNDKCAALGATYFGVQAGHACFCGNTYGSQGLARMDSYCSTPCAGNISEVCGGSDLNSIYSVHNISKHV